MTGDRRTVTAVRHTSAPVERVWALLGTTSTWKDWGWFTVAELEREGDEHPDGVGAIKRLGLKAGGSREEIVEYDPPHHLAYVLLQGLPVKDYRSDVTLTPTPDGGTSIEWKSSFRGNRLWAALLQAMITGFARRLAKASAAATR
jgi:uncharacterized protein YndB with AHSA1/START domain